MQKFAFIDVAGNLDYKMLNYWSSHVQEAA